MLVPAALYNPAINIIYDSCTGQVAELVDPIPRGQEDQSEDGVGHWQSIERSFVKKSF